jgi:hypothetical protein
VLGEDLVVVPVEIEIDSMLYNRIQIDILSHFDAGHGMQFQELVNICFKERMEQIITDPKGWGKLLLNQIREVTVILLIIGIAIQTLSTSVITTASLENTKNVIPGTLIS